MNFLDSATHHTRIVHGQTYNLYEAGAGQPLLLLHGFTGAAASWQHVLPRLASRYRVIVPDLLGHGASSAPDAAAPFAIERQAADLVALLDLLGVGGGVHGYSMGGRLALYIALTYPTRISALSLESASPGLESDSQRAARRHADEALAARIMGQGIGSFVDQWAALPLFSTQAAAAPELLSLQRETRLNQRPVGLANSLRGMGTGAQPSLWDRLSELTIPVQLMTGIRDTKFDAIADRMAAVLPQARRVRVPDAGHTVYLEQPDAWIAAVLNFLG